MRGEVIELVSELTNKINNMKSRIGYFESKKRLDEINLEIENPSLWDDADKAQIIMKEKNSIEAKIDEIDNFIKEITDNSDIIELAELENETDMVLDAEKALNNLKIIIEKAELRTLLSGEADSYGCYLEINSGAGGTEAQDWAGMLLRMYLRWVAEKGYDVEYMDEHAGEEAGIKSAALKISGENAYGWLKSENGVHRLVRISPFDSNARRHTSFAGVIVSPVIDDKIDIHIEDKDVRVDTFRASGAGGQHVNKTDSAIRITHIPTGIVVQCQSGRSQHRNRDTAWSMLRAKLYELELQKKEMLEKKNYESMSSNGWGSQIRSYVLQPYQMVKDLRTGAETSNVNAVLDGDIDLFLEAYLSFSKET